MSDIKINFDSERLKTLIDQRVKTALTSIGIAAQGYARQALTESGAVDTGTLRNSIKPVVNGNTVVIGTNVEYAGYIEFGTGKYAAGGGGTNKESWVYHGEDGKFHRAYPQKPRPFIKPAIADHIDEYKRLVSEEMRNIGK